MTGPWLAAAFAGLALWLLLPGPPRGRARGLWAPAREASGSIDLALVAAVLTPLAALLLLGWPLGPVLGLLAAPAVRSAASNLETTATRRRSARAARQLPAALDLVTAALESGRPPGLALRLAAEATADPLAADLSTVAHRVVVASDLRSALADVTGPLVPLARSLRRAEQTGVPIADVIAAVATDVRREQQATRRELARRVGVRTAAPLGVCFLPAFLLIGIVPTIIATATSLRLF